MNELRADGKLSRKHSLMDMHEKKEEEKTKKQILDDAFFIC